MRKFFLNLLKTFILSFATASFFLLTLIISTRLETQINVDYITKDLILTDKSKEEAEILNLAQVQTQPTQALTYSTIHTSSQFVNTASEKILSKMNINKLDFKLYETLNLNKDMSIDFTSVSDQLKIYNLLKVDYKLLQELGWNIQKDLFLANLKETVNKYNLSSVIFSKEFSKIENLFEIVQEIQSLRDQNVILGLITYPIWGDEVNYKHFYQLKNNLFSSQTPSQIAEKFDYIFINGFEFTNEYSILPYKISDISLLSRVIQYAIKNNIPRSKIIINLQMQAYKWPQRYIPRDFRENYTWFEPQAEVLARIEKLTDIILKLDENNFCRQTFEDKNFIIVQLDDKFFVDAKQVAQNYGIYGISFTI
jgi:hypothetical protein